MNDVLFLAIDLYEMMMKITGELDCRFSYIN